MRYKLVFGFLWMLVLGCGSPGLDQQVDERLQYQIKAGPPELVEKLRPLYEKLRTDPLDKVTFNNIGDIYFHYDMMEDARLMFDFAIRIDSTYVPALFNLSVIEMKEKKFQPGVNLLLQVLKVDPNHIRAITNLSDYYYKTGQFNKALEYTHLAYNLQPENSRMAYNLAVIYLALEDSVMGKEYLEKSLQLDPLNQTARQRLNMILYENQ